MPSKQRPRHHCLGTGAGGGLPRRCERRALAVTGCRRTKLREGSRRSTGSTGFGPAACGLRSRSSRRCASRAVAHRGHGTEPLLRVRVAGLGYRIQDLGGWVPGSRARRGAARRATRTLRCALASGSAEATSHHGQPCAPIPHAAPSGADILRYALPPTLAPLHRRTRRTRRTRRSACTRRRSACALRALRRSGEDQHVTRGQSRPWQRCSPAAAGLSRVARVASHGESAQSDLERQSARTRRAHTGAQARRMLRWRPGPHARAGTSSLAAITISSQTVSHGQHVSKRLAAIPPRPLSASRSAV